MLLLNASAAVLTLAAGAPQDPLHLVHVTAPEEPVVIADVMVAGRRDPANPAVAARARTQVQETPGAVAVVSREHYENHLAMHLGDALHAVPGVMAEKRWGEEVRLSIRGSGVGNSNHNRGVVLAQDGVPFNQADGFGDFQEIDLLSARYIEVYKGGNAIRFGGAAMGGAIELNTPTGRNAPERNEIRLEAGSFETWRAHGEMAREWGDYDLWAGVSVLGAEGWRDHSVQGSQRLSLNAGRRFGDDREVRVLFSAADIQNEIPGALTLDQALSNPTAAAAANLARDYRRDMTSLRGSMQTRWRLNDAWTFEGGVYGAFKELDHPISVVLVQDSRNLGAFGRLDWTGGIGGLNADLFVGAWLRDGKLDGLTFQNIAGERGALTGDNTQRATAIDAFAEARLFVSDRLALVAGGSWGRATRDYVDHVNPSRSADKDFEWFAPRIGLLWEGESGWHAFANLTRSVEPPHFSALVQTPHPEFVPVEAQEAWTVEIGTRGRKGPLAWDFALYRMDVRNELLTFLAASDIPAATFNAGDTVHQGFEAGLDWTIWRDGERRLKLHQTWAWTDLRFDGDAHYGDGRLPVVPEHHYHAELSYSTGRWSIAPSVQWTPDDTWVDYANTLRSPGFAVWSLNATWAATAGIKLFLDARNLTDEVYVSNVSAVTDARVAPTAVFWPGEGRSAFVGVRSSF